MHFLTNLALITILFSCAASLFIALLIVATKSWHGKYSYDSIVGAQKIHSEHVPRVGGLAIFGGFCLIGYWIPAEVQNVFNPLLLLGLIAFSFGFLEDLTKQVPVVMRLWATMIPGVMGYYLTDYSLNDFGYAWLNYPLHWPVVAIAFTAFAVCGLIHAINVIDGFNGLASFTSIWILFGLIGLSLFAGDIPIALVALALVGSTLGFLALNWPWGKLFLGDGGSYFLGVSIAWLCVALVNRNPAISPFACLVLCSYPIIETLFSIARRLRSRMSTGQPDSLHLHQLIAKAFIYPALKERFAPAYVNSVTGFGMSLLSIPGLVLALSFSQEPQILIASFGGLVLAYTALYLGVQKLANEQTT